VVDDDFSSAQFPGIAGLDALRVTAAHEFFHAVQFGYDLAEDAWLKESTAAWIEDVIYDSVNDNYQYLSRSPLSHPEVPLDSFVDFNASSPVAGFHYGVWIFFRYLSERYDDQIIHDITTRLDSRSTDFRDVYSLEAIRAELIERGTTLPAAYADFMAQNVRPAGFYEEGAAYQRNAALALTHTLGTTSPSAIGTFSEDHLSSRYVSFRPAAGTDPAANLSVAVRLPAAATSPVATVVSVPTAGTPTSTQITITNGEGTATVPFGSTSEVVLVLSNASSRIPRSSCNFFQPQTPFSCGGRPSDEDQGFGYSGALGDTPVEPGDPGGPPVDSTAPRITNVVDRPDPFRPNGTRLWHLLFTINEASFVSVEVRNPAGRRVLRLADSVGAGTRIDANWNGVLGRRFAPNGRYAYIITATDAADNRRVARGSVTIRR
jgi:hypothetical protein